MQTTTLPVSTRRFHLPASTRFPTPEGGAARNPLTLDRGGLIESLWSLLPLSEHVGTRLSEEELSRRDLASRRRLEQAVEEIDRLFSLLARAGLEIRNLAGDSDRERAAFRAKWTERRKQLSWAFSFREPCNDDGITDEFSLEQAAENGEPRLVRRLRLQVEQFVDALLDKFEQLSRENHLGRVTWEGNGNCRFYFFGEAVLLEGPVLATRTERTLKVREDARYVTIENVKVRQWDSTHRAIRHEHRLVAAKTISLSDPSFAVPTAVEEIVTAIPVWLQSASNFVIGDCIHERIIERDVRTDRREEVISREFVQTVRLFDPALTIGPYVLTGWGAREIRTAENVRRRREQLSDRELVREERRSSRLQSRWLGISAMVGGAALIGLGFSISAFAAILGTTLLGVGILLLGYSISNIGQVDERSKSSLPTPGVPHA